MDDLLTPAQFIDRAIGIPWRRGRADWTGCNCFGLLILWHRHVLGVEIGAPPETDDLAVGFSRAAGWIECEPAPGATGWMAWRDGAPRHCGVLVGADQVLHSDGRDDRPGSVRITRLAALRALYADLRFYRFKPC